MVGTLRLWVCSPALHESLRALITVGSVHLPFVLASAVLGSCSATMLGVCAPYAHGSGAAPYAHNTTDGKLMPLGRRVWGSRRSALLGTSPASVTVTVLLLPNPVSIPVARADYPHSTGLLCAPLSTLILTEEQITVHQICI